MGTILQNHKEVWEKKKILRIIYSAWYRKIIRDLHSSSNPTVELGAGSGNFKEFKPDVISSDIDPCDCVSYVFKGKKKFTEMFGEKFIIQKKHKLSCILHPASGGFENKSMVPDFLIPVFRFFEILMVPFRFFFAFRCYVVIEKVG